MKMLTGTLTTLSRPSGVKNILYIPLDAEKEKNMADFEIYARNIITHIHDRARKKMSLPDFRHAADAYDVYLSFFEESPAYEEMEDNYAEAPFFIRPVP